MTELVSDLQREPRATRRGPWIRRAIMAVFAIVAILALANVFGQQPTVTAAGGTGAELALSAPRVVRGGLMFQARIDVRARLDIDNPRLVLGQGWLEGLQVNSIQPAPVSEAGRDGRVVLTYDELAAGERLRIWIQFAVDPTYSGRHDFSVELDDETTPLATVTRTITLLP